MDSVENLVDGGELDGQLPLFDLTCDRCHLPVVAVPPARYNRSNKGQARNRAYEARHPERKMRWPALQGARLPDRRPE